MEQVDVLIKKSEEIIDQAIEIALKEVQRIARKELHSNKKLKRFTMYMGTYFFSDSDGPIFGYECQELDSFIDKYCDLHLTGCAMSFTKNGEVLTNW